MFFTSLGRLYFQSMEEYPSLATIVPESRDPNLEIYSLHSKKGFLEELDKNYCETQPPISMLIYVGGSGELGSETTISGTAVTGP